LKRPTRTTTSCPPCSHMLCVCPFSHTCVWPSVCQVTYLVQAQVGGSLPRALLNTRIKSSLATVHNMQDKFERKGKVVDAEMRSAFPLPPPLAELNDEQKLVVESCRYLESEEGCEWEPLPSSSPFVDMWYKHTPAKRGERSIVLGKATAGESSIQSADLFLLSSPVCSHMYAAVIDCSAHDALAFFFAVGGREHLRTSSEQGNPARLVQKRTGSNDMVWATIKKLPSPLHNREFVNRLVCCLDVNGELLLISVPVDDVIDYGVKTNTVRGVSRALMRLIPAGDSRCKLTYYMHVDAGGRIPAFVMDSKIPLTLGAVGDLREKFQRDNEIDKAEGDELARIIKMDEQRTYTAEEDMLINKVDIKLGVLGWEHFEELESPDHHVKMGKIFIDGSSSAVGRGSTIVDASVEDCAAWELAKTSRESLSNSRSLARSFAKTNVHHGLFHLVFDLHIPGFLPREFLTEQVWRRQGEKLAVAYESVEHDDFPLNPSYVRGTSTAYWEYEKLQPVGGLPQTRVTYTPQIDLGGLIPKSVVNSGAVGQLMYLSTMRKRFDKSLEVDGATRALNVEIIMGHVGVEYTAAEQSACIDGEYFFDLFSGLTAKALNMESPLTKAEIVFKKKDSHAWGRATTTVRARPEEVLAFTWDTMRRTEQKEDDVEKAVVEHVSDHNVLVYNKKRTPKIISDRDFLGRVVWKAKGQGFVVVTSPEENALRPITDSAERGKYPSAMKIERKNDRETVLELVFQINFGGRLPTWLTNSYVGAIAGAVTEIQEYFQELRGVEEWDADDARAVGEVMCIKTEAEKHPEKGESKKGARVRELFKKQKALKQIGRKYEFFESMITRVVENKLRTTGEVKSKLCSVSAKEGRKIGAGLALALASNLTAEAAVDEWILKYKSLGELDRTEEWFR